MVFIKKSHFIKDRWGADLKGVSIFQASRDANGGSMEGVSTPPTSQPGRGVSYGWQCDLVSQVRDMA